MDHYDEDDAPPPYSAIDPLSQSRPVANNNASVEVSSHLDVNHNDHQIELPLRLRGGEASLLATPTASTSANEATPEIFSQGPVSFASAAGYFTEHPLPSVSAEKRDTLIHHLTIYARSQRKDFPRRPRCWNSRADEINQHDWDTFLNFLFPTHLAPAASSNHLPRQVRAEIERDRKDRSQETDEERDTRISAVLTEWNEGFFGPRGTWVSWVYVADLNTGSPSPLCSECYPSATQALQNRNRHVRTRSSEAPMSVEVEPASQSTPRQPVTTQPDDGLISVQLESPTSPSHPPRLGPPWAMGGPGIFPTFPPPFGRSQFRHQGPFPASWGHNSLDWAAQLSARAQQYAEKVSEQAQEYSKKIEDNAMLHGRQMEEAGDRFSYWASGFGHRHGWPEWPPNVPTRPTHNPRSEENVHSGPHQHPRRASTSSNSSSTSFSSIDSVSTVSDLDPADLSTVRAQLLSLDGYHHRELHTAAVELRSHLRILQQSRRESRFRSHHGGFGSRRGHWGRWESPEEGRQREHQRRAMREETRALRETFRAVERRAREENRERRRARRERKRLRQGRGLEEGRVRHILVQDQELARAQRIDIGVDKEVFVSASHPNPNATRSPHATSFAVRTPSDSGPSASPTVESGAAFLSPSPTAPATASNPRDATKAWADTQKAKAKEIQKLDKERRKAIEKSHKDREKELRKAAKNASKYQRPGERQGPSSENSSGIGSHQWSWHNTSTHSVGVPPGEGTGRRVSSTSSPLNRGLTQESGVISRDAELDGSEVGQEPRQEKRA